MEKKGEGKFDYKAAIEMLKTMNADKEKIDLKMFHNLCKAFTKISSSMGYLVSWGFNGTI